MLARTARENRAISIGLRDGPSGTTSASIPAGLEAGDHEPLDRQVGPENLKVSVTGTEAVVVVEELVKKAIGMTSWTI